MRGMLMSFSGLDGAGKTTQIELLVSRLKSAGYKPVVIWARGGYTSGVGALKKLLRQISRNRIIPPSGHSQKREKMLAKPIIRRVWLLMAIIDLIWILGVKARWSRWRGKVVICDRYLWDTEVDFKINFPNEHVDRWWLWRMLRCLASKPDLAFALLVPVPESLIRSAKKNEPFPDAPGVLEKRLRAYQEMSDWTGWRILDGCRPIEDLASEIWEKILVAKKLAKL